MPRGRHQVRITAHRHHELIEARVAVELIVVRTLRADGIRQREARRKADVGVWKQVVLVKAAALPCLRDGSVQELIAESDMEVSLGQRPLSKGIERRLRLLTEGLRT